MSGRHRREVERLASEYGCLVARGRGGHLHVLLNADQPVLVAVAPSTPGDWRGMKNLRSNLRRAVLEGGSL